jgi:hypothetical protein
MTRTSLSIALLAATHLASAASFTYRGALNDGGAPANGRYDLRLTLLDAASGREFAPPVTLFGVEVVHGQFSHPVEFAQALELAPPLTLRSEVKSPSGGFVEIGQPSPFDPRQPLLGAAWSLNGNAGTDPAVNFLGTIDGQSLVVRVANVRALRLEPSAILQNGVPITANVIAGSRVNGVEDGVRGATISGGGMPSGDSDPTFANEGPNRVTDHYGVVAGGYNNQAGNADGTPTNAPLATVGGGVFNRASALAATVSGGNANSVVADYGTIGGGNTNFVSGAYGTVSGGNSNSATGFAATVLGGDNSLATGALAVALGGRFNCAGGDSSFAMGLRAKVRPGNQAIDIACPGANNSGDSDGDQGTLVWADSTPIDYISNGPNRALFRASGGAVIQAPIGNETVARAPRGFFNVVRGASGIAQPATADAATLAAFENDGNNFVRLFTPAAATAGMLTTSPNGVDYGGFTYAAATDTLRLLTKGSPGVIIDSSQGVTLPALSSSSGAIAVCRDAQGRLGNCSSSRRYKHAIESLDPIRLLELVRQLKPVSYRWNDDGMADVGFVAEEVAALDERLITRNARGQIEGVKYDRLTALLVGAIQVLSAEHAREQTESAALAKRLNALNARAAELEAALVRSP